MSPVDEADRIVKWAGIVLAWAASVYITAHVLVAAGVGR